MYGDTVAHPHTTGRAVGETKNRERQTSQKKRDIYRVVNRALVFCN